MNRQKIIAKDIQEQYADWKLLCTQVGFSQFSEMLSKFDSTHTDIKKQFILTYIILASVSVFLIWIRISNICNYLCLLLLVFLLFFTIVQIIIINKKKKLLEYKINSDIDIFNILGIEKDTENILSTELINNADLFCDIHKVDIAKSLKLSHKGLELHLGQTVCSHIEDNKCDCCFDGLLLYIKMNKPFHGKTLLTQNTFKDIKSSDKYKQVHFDKQIMNNTFKVFSTDETEAKYLLTTAFIEKFTLVLKRLRALGVRCSFFDDNVLIAIKTKRKFFDLPIKINKTLNANYYFDLVCNDIISIMALADILKLEQDIGL